MNHLSNEQQALLTLVQQSLWRNSKTLPEPVDWETVDSCAKQQGVLALAYDGAAALKAEMPAEIRQKWNQQTIMSVMKNERLLAAQDQILGWLEQENIPAVILKGSSVSRYYPQPDLRVLGDIDILVPRNRVEGVKEIMLQQGYTFHDSGHDFHLGFSRSGVCAEIHYDVTRLPNGRGGEITKKETARFLEKRDTAEVLGHIFPVLTEQYQALSLLLHMVRHMLGGGIGLRQLCDWAMYLTNGDTKAFVETTVPMLDRCGLLRYAQIATRVCVCYLGLSAQHAGWCVDVTDADIQAFIKDVFRSGNMGKADPEKMGRVLSHSQYSGEKQSYIKMIFASLTEICYQNFPLLKKYRILLPLAWVYIPMRYWVRSLFGLRKRKSIGQAAKNAKTQRDFYHMLGIFTVDEASEETKD